MIDLIKSGPQKNYKVDTCLKYNKTVVHTDVLSRESVSVFEPTIQSDGEYVAYSNIEEKKEDKNIEQDVISRILELDEEDSKRLKENTHLEDATLEELSRWMGQTSELRNYTVNQYNEKVERLKAHTDSMYTYALSKEGTLTIQDLYKGSFTGSASKPKSSYSKADIKSILNMNHIESTEGNAWVASKLLSLGIDVSSEAVLKVQNIYTAIEELEQYEVGQEELEEIAEKKLEDKVLIEGEGRPYEEENVQKLKEDLSKVNDEDIKEVVSKGQEVTIHNLREAMLKNTQKVVRQHEEEPMQEASIQEEPIDVEAESIEDTKKQINEIRARLNTETAQRLSQIMPLESTELAKVAEGLRKVELEIGKEALVKAEVPLSKESLSTLEQVMDAAKIIGRHKELATKIQIESTGEATLEEFHGVLEHYEENATAARARFGEGVKKVEGQIEGFLNRQNLPQDELTIKSSKALIANGMELSEHNLEATKIALSKIESFLTFMNPYEAARLIKEGINPYEASIDTILEMAQKEDMLQIKETIAKTLVELENKGQINNTQKQSLIGMYRILNGVALHKEQVAGYLFKNGLPLTLEKLEEAVKYVGKSEYIQAVVDDEFGLLEEAKYHKQTARQLIETSSLKLKKLLQTVGMVEHMPIELVKTQGDELTALKSMIYPFIKGAIKKEIGKFDGMNTLPESLLEKVNGIKDTSKEVLQTMKKHEIPLTLSNIYWVDRLSKESGFYEKLLKDTGGYKKLEDRGFPDKVEALEEVLKELKEDSTLEKDICLEQGDLSGYKNYKYLEEVARVQAQLREKEGLYQIPFVIEGTPKMIQLYIKEDSKKKDIHKEGMTAVMSYDTRALGKVTTYFTVRGEDIHYKMHTENKASEEALQQTKEKLKEMMDAIGYKIIKGSYEHKEEEVKPLTGIVLRGESKFETII